MRALMHQLFLLSPFSFFFPPPRSLHSDCRCAPLSIIHEENLSPPFPPRPLCSSAGEV